MKRILFALIVIMSLALAARAQPLIQVGNYQLQPNTSGQELDIIVHNGGVVEGLNLLLQLGDGGAALGGVNGSAPKIQDISITTGTIFDGNNTGRVFDDVPANQFWQIHTTTASGTVLADGILARVVVDTTGFSNGVYQLLLGHIGGDSNANTDFAGVGATIINGTISIPEPAACAFLPLAITALLRRRRRTLSVLEHCPAL